MGIRLYPDSRERVTLVLTEDGAIAEANTAEALADYAKTGDLTRSTVPDDAVRFVVRPLTASGRAWSYRQAGEYPAREMAVAQLAQSKAAALKAEGIPDEEAGKRAVEDTGLSDDDVATIADYEQRLALWQCCAALEVFGTLPDKPTTVGGVRRFPPEVVERLPMPARMELHGHILRVSSVSDEGKACSGSGSGPP